MTEVPVGELPLAASRRKAAQMMRSITARTPGISPALRRSVYDCIAESGPLTKNELATAADISLPTATKYLAHLSQLGLIAEGEKLAAGAQGGRSPVTYHCVPDGWLAVGVNITSDHANAVIVNLDGEMTHVREMDEPFENSERYAKLIADLVLGLLKDARVRAERVHGVGVAMPGLVSEEEQRVTYGRVIDNAGMTADFFARHLPFPVRLVHDSDASGLAEFWTTGDAHNAFYLSISNSIGGAVLINDTIYRGDGEFAGEVGHLILYPGGERCYCGQQGCFDAYCNAKVLRRHAGGLRQFFARLRRGDAAAQAVWEDYCTHLARAVQAVRVLYGCTVIIGGDVGAWIDENLDDVRRKVVELDLLPGKPADYLTRSRCTTKPIAIGAALYIVDSLKDALGPAMSGVVTGPRAPTTVPHGPRVRAYRAASANRAKPASTSSRTSANTSGRASKGHQRTS